MDADTSDHDRIAVCKAIVDHWISKTAKLSRKKRFRQLHNVFKTLKETEIADALKEKFEVSGLTTIKPFGIEFKRQIQH